MATATKSRHTKTLFDELKEDHKEVKHMLGSLMKSDGGQEREEIFSKMKAALLAHAKAEEEMFYPVLEEEKVTHTEALEAEAEHEVVENLLEELDGAAEKDSDEWLAKCKVLRDMVEHHVKEEEGQIFKDARKVLGKGRLTELAGEFEAAKEKFM